MISHTVLLALGSVLAHVTASPVPLVKRGEVSGFCQTLRFTDKVTALKTVQPNPERGWMQATCQGPDGDRVALGNLAISLFVDENDDLQWLDNSSAQKSHDELYNEANPTFREGYADFCSIDDSWNFRCRCNHANAGAQFGDRKDCSINLYVPSGDFSRPGLHLYQDEHGELYFQGVTRV